MQILDDGSCEYEMCEFKSSLLILHSWWLARQKSSWYIDDSLGNQIIDGVVDQFYSICVPTGTYKVVGEDTYGDGWNSATLTAVDTLIMYYLNWTFNEGLLILLFLGRLQNTVVQIPLQIIMTLQLQ